MTPVLGIIASSTRQGQVTAVGSYDALATVTVPSGGLASVTFAGIPSGYQHLQLRTMVRTNRADTIDFLNVQFNSDTSANYAWHFLFGDGASAGASAGASETSIRNLYPTAANTAANIFGVFVIDIVNYASTSKTKTTRSLGGFDANGAGIAQLGSGLWNNTAAINNIVLTPISGNSFVQNSNFALYGVK
jgi:hypothetical protein